jgi:hypothetical protein
MECDRAVSEAEVAKSYKECRDGAFPRFDSETDLFHAAIVPGEYPFMKEGFVCDFRHWPGPIRR